MIAATSRRATPDPASTVETDQEPPILPALTDDLDLNKPFHGDHPRPC